MEKQPTFIDKLSTCFDKLGKRLAAEEGFSLIELLTVIIILSILALIAIPSYAGFKENALQRTAQLNVNSAIPIAVQYYSANGDSYVGLSSHALQTLSPGISPNVTAGYALGGTAFCIQAQAGDMIYAYPGGQGGDNTLQQASCFTGTGGYNMG